MGKTIRSYDRDSLKGMKTIKKNKPRHKHVQVEDYLEEDEIGLEYDRMNYDDTFPDTYSA